MSPIQTVEVGALSVERFTPLLGEERVHAALDAAQRLRESLGDATVWNVNSTSVGGGVAEMLRPLLAYSRGAGIDVRWAVIQGEPDFFRITKRLHHALHGAGGDGSELGPRERERYEATLHENAVELGGLVRSGDVVILHDPQTAGLAPAMARAGALVIWRCHIGADTAGPEVERGWVFLEPYLKEVAASIFSREAYVPSYCDHGRSHVIPPSIDAFSSKNRELDPALMRTALVHAGLVEGPPPEPCRHHFERPDGSTGRIERRADVVRLGRAPTWDTPLVVQVSRWDPLKDMRGVMEGFARMVDGAAPGDAELVLAGPNVKAVADDPEGGRVFDEILEAWRALPHGVRARVHLASLPTADVDENAILVNALQRHAAVVVQKSLHEGFGLTVTEAMWKARPVLASEVGGIRDQIEDGVSGVLLRDPTDLDDFAAKLRGLLEDPERAAAIGAAARERVREQFLGIRHLVQYAELIRDLLPGAPKKREPVHPPEEPR